MIREVQKYVPGYRLVNRPVSTATTGLGLSGGRRPGDYLPKYAGNLDIMTGSCRAPPRCSPEEILAGSLSNQSRSHRLDGIHGP